MVARFGVVFPASMVDILTNPVEICFDSFTVTSTTLAAVTYPTASIKVPVTPVATPNSNLKSKTHMPKPYDIFQGMERVIDMMEETLQIRERAQRSTQDMSRRKTFPFGLRLSSDACRGQPRGSSKKSGESYLKPTKNTKHKHSSNITQTVTSGRRERHPCCCQSCAAIPAPAAPHRALLRLL
jgi:hypothetical protein